MTRFWRRLIFCGLISIFIIVTPLVLLYALGYGFDWQKKSFVQTGALYLKSIPKGAQIFINNKPQNKTPRFIRHLLPQTYEIKIFKDGFQSWEKQLKVESRLVTEARNILLTPANPQIELVRENLNKNFSLENFLSSDAQKQKIEQASTTANNLLKTLSYELANDTIFYIQAPNYLLYAANLDGANIRQITIEPLLPATYKIIISPNQNLAAAINQQGQLYFLNPDKRIFEKIAEGVKAAEFSLDDKKLLYWHNSEIWVMFLEDILIQPYKKTGEKELITRFSKNVHSVIWYTEDNEHLIFMVDNTIKIAELDDRNKINITDFLVINNSADNNQSQIFYYLKEKKLYFIDNKNLYAAPL